jgi:hypothetical protein
MTQQSIFHNIVSRETAYTQLLCNLLKRDSTFCSAFLKGCGVEDSLAVDPADIAAERRLDHRSGQADILIEAPNLCMIIEIKTELHRGKQSTQETPEIDEIDEINDNDENYLGWLRRRKKSSPSTMTRLVFLIPSQWVHRTGVEEQIEKYEKSLVRDAVPVKVLLWPQLLKISKDSPNKLVEEFRLLIADRFGPIGFETEETQLMCNSDFPIETIVKLISLIEQIRLVFHPSSRKKLKPASKLYIEKGEFGFYLTNATNNKCSLFFGLWPDLWKDPDFWRKSSENASPICFGVETSEVSADVRKAFQRSLKSIYKQTPFPFGGYELGYIPQKDFDENKDDALETLKHKLEKLWDEMSQAAG